MKYDHIIHLGRPASAHPAMPMADRAAQFSPFAALTGYDDEVKEAARLTEDQAELGDELRDELDAGFAAIMERMHEQPEVEVRYFEPDEKKDGGRHLTITGRLRTFDAGTRELVFVDRRRVSADMIVALRMMAAGEK